MVTIIAWVFIAVITIVLLVCMMAPFILSGKISEREEQADAEAQIRAWAPSPCATCDHPDDQDCELCAKEREARAGGRIAQKAREAADVLQGVAR